MISSSGEKKADWENRGVAALWVLGLFLLLSWRFDFYYDLNDDVALKDILSGTYTGVPDGHNVQMLYPLGACLSFLYKIIPQIPWLGVFLCGFQFFALFLMGLCFLKKSGQKVSFFKKMAIMGALTLAFFVLCSYELVFIQYTVTSGMLVTAALVWFYAEPDWKETDKQFFFYHSITVFLLLTAFCIRTEMMLLLLPFFCLAGLFRLLEKREKWKFYIGAVFVLGLGMGLCVLADSAAYGSREWKTFRHFFDERTTVYDFYRIEDFGKDQDFFETTEVSDIQYTLLKNYNFGLDDSIDDKLMERVADYGSSHLQESTGRRLYLSAYTYVYRFLHGQDLTYNCILVFGYFIALKASFAGKKWWRVYCLFLLRTALWLFLLYRGRVPERITHPLMVVEIAMLTLLLIYDTNVLQWKKYEKSGILILYAILFLGIGLYHGEAVRQQYAHREEKNKEWQQLKQYCREHKNQFFYLDVYSTVAYSEKMFTDISPEYRNFDLLGGWCVKSPLSAKKQERAGIICAKDALLGQKADFIIDMTIPEMRNADFLTEYYGSMGIDINVEEAGQVSCFKVLRIREE